MEENLLSMNLQPFADDLANAEPDIYDGLNPSDVDKQLRKDLDRFIVPTSHGRAPIVPTFFFKIKGPDRVESVLK